MASDSLDRIKQKRQEAEEKARQQADKQDSIGAVKEGSEATTTAIHDLMLATLVSKDPRIPEVAKNLSDLLAGIEQASKNIKSNDFKGLSDDYKQLQRVLIQIPKEIERANKLNDPAPELAKIAQVLGAKEFRPNITVEPSKVDLKPLEGFLKDVKKTLEANKVEIPENDLGELQEGVSRVEKAIKGLQFPVANYILPFKDPTTGKATQVLLDSSGNVPVTGTVDIDPTGLATSAKQDTQITELQDIEADVEATNTRLGEVQASPTSNTVLDRLKTIGTNTTGISTSAKQDTGNTSLASILTTQTDKSQFTKLTDGTDTALITASGEQNVLETNSAAIKTAVEKIDDAIAGSEMQVDVVTSALPSGASTSANQTTIIGHLDGVEGLLTTIDTDTGSILTNQTSGGQKTQLVDAGGDAVTVTGGKLDVNATVTGGTGSSAIDDAAFAIATDSGTPVMGLFDDVTPDSVGEGDVGVLRMSANRNAYVTLRDAAGNERGLNVAADGSIGVTNGGLTELAAAINSSKVDVNIASSDVASGGTSSADDADFTAGTTAGTPAMGVYESTPTNVTDGDLGTVGITQGRRLKTSATIDAALPAGTNNIGDVDVLSSALPTGASTLAEQQTQTTALQLLDDTVFVDDADFTDGTSKGLGVMGVAENTPTTVTDGDMGMIGIDPATRAVKIHDGGNTITVDGTVTANAGTNLNTSALLTTAAHDAAFGTAGSADAQVRTIQGVASMTPVQVSQATASNLNVTEASAASILTSVQLIDDAVYTDDTSTHATGTSKGLGIMAVADPTDTTVNANDIAMPAMTTARALKNDITTIAGTAAVSGSGTATGALRVELPTNGTGIVGLAAGTNGIGKLTANSGVDIGDVDVTSAVTGTIDHGSNRDIDTSAEQITSTSFACKFGLTLRADPANTGTLYIGNSDVTAGTTAATDGIPILPGDSLFLPVSNSNIPYAIASANNQIIYWIGA